MKNPFLYIVSTIIIVLFSACQQSQKAAPPIIVPSIQATTQLKPINVPATYKYQPIKLTGNEVAYKDLKFETAANNQKLAMQNGQSFTGATVYKLNNDQIFIYQTYSNGIKHGPYQVQQNGQDDNGNPDNTFETGTMVNGKINGLQLTYYDGPGGPLKKASFYKHDVMDSQWCSYYRSGAQWTRRDFDNGKINGKVLVWDENGVLGKEYTYRNGQMIEKLNHFENR